MSIGARRMWRHSEIDDTPPPTGDLSVSGQPSTFYAAGFHQALHIADNTVHGELAISGGDVHGMTRTTNAGVSWEMTNDGITSNANKFVRGVTAHGSQAGVAYALCGSGGAQVLKSTNGGATWQARNSARFGIGDGGDTGTEQPRRVQNLIVADPTTSGAGTILYAGCGNGIFRSTNDGANWSSLSTGSSSYALQSSAVTAIALDPNNPSILYACTDRGSSTGLYKITNIKGPGNAVVTEIKTSGSSGSSLPDCQDLCTVKHPGSGVTEVWVAAGSNANSSLTGIFRYIPNSNTMHNVTPSAANTTENRWSAIDVKARSGALSVLITASSTAIPGSLNKTSVWRHTSGQSLTSSNRSGWIDTWSSDTFSKKVLNASGDDYWLYTYSNSFMATGMSWDSSSVQIHPNDPNIAMITGRSTIIRTNNFLSANASWFMASVGYGSVAVYGLTVDQNNPNKLFFNGVDWEFVTSTDGLVNNQPRARGISGSGPSWASTLDKNGVGYVGTSNLNMSDGGTAGKLYTLADPFSSSPTTITNLNIGNDLVAQGAISSSTALGSPRALDVIYNGSTRKLTAFFNGKTTSGGIVHKSANNAARMVLNLGSSAGGAYQSKMVHQTNSSGSPTGVMFFYTHSHGLYRSRDWGLSWERVWAFSEISDSESMRVTGDLCCVPGSTSLYITALMPNNSARLYRIDNAHVAGSTVTTGSSSPYNVTAAGGCTITNLTGSADFPGRLAYNAATDRLVIAQPKSKNSECKLFVSQKIGAGSETPLLMNLTFQEWRSYAMFPLGLVSSGNKVYCRTDGMGIYVLNITE